MLVWCSFLHPTLPLISSGPTEIATLSPSLFSAHCLDFFLSRYYISFILEIPVAYFFFIVFFSPFLPH